MGDSVHTSFIEISARVLHQQRTVPFGIGIAEQQAQILSVYFPERVHAGPRDKSRRNIIANDRRIVYGRGDDGLLGQRDLGLVGVGAIE